MMTGSVGMIGLPGALARADEAAGSADGTAGDESGLVPSPQDRRERPGCLDIEWGDGTGLIWMEGESLFYENPRNRFIRFRKTFDLDAAPTAAEWRLFTDTHYIAWLNGAEVGRGPGRSDRTWAYYDPYDVADRLVPGRNTLSVLVLFQGFGTGGRQSIMQALLSCLKMDFDGADARFVVSDESWRASPAEEFVRPSPRLHATLGCAEVQDLRLADAGWEGTDYDDSSWVRSAYVKGGLMNTPWYHFVPEPLPHRVLTDLPFPAAVTVAEVELALPTVSELGAVRPKPGAELSANLPVRVGGGDAPEMAALDLGRSECGYFSMDVSGPAGAVIDVVCGELTVEGIVPKPAAARVHTSRFVLAGGRDVVRVRFNWLAFRIAQLWVWSPEPVTIHSATLERMALPLGAGGHFRCDDEMLNRLDGICEHTLRLCSQDGILDSSSREQQQWIGDGRFTAVTLHHRFDVAVLHRRLIEQIGQGLDWLGAMVPRYPTGNVNVSPLPLYHLQWVLAFGDYEWFTGDRTLLPAWLPHIRQVLRWFTAFEREDGLLTDVPHWMYIDLGERTPGRTPDTGSINTTLNLYYLAALRYAHGVFAEDAALAADLERRAVRLAHSIREVLWDEEVGAYRDCLLEDGTFGTLSEIPNANALIHLEEVGSVRAKQLIESIFVTRTGDPIWSSPFMMNVNLEGLAKHGRADLVFPMLAKRYPEQIESGNTWEQWSASHWEGDVPYCHSLSHAWGAGPLAFFVNTVVGIRLTQAGWAEVLVEPTPGPLKRAEASVETGRGRIYAAWKVVGGGIELDVELPPGMVGRCRLPGGESVTMPAGGGRFRGPLA